MNHGEQGEIWRERAGRRLAWSSRFDVPQLPSWSCGFVPVTRSTPFRQVNRLAVVSLRRSDHVLSDLHAPCVPGSCQITCPGLGDGGVASTNWPSLVSSESRTTVHHSHASHRPLELRTDAPQHEPLAVSSPHESGGQRQDEQRAEPSPRPGDTNARRIALQRQHARCDCPGCRRANCGRVGPRWSLRSCHVHCSFPCLLRIIELAAR